YSSDTYIYNLGDGNDTIVDYDGGYAKADKLVFGEGIKPSDIAFRRIGAHLIFVVTNSATGEESTITLENAATSSLYRIEALHFADGSIIDGDLFASLEVQGTSGDDVMVGINESEVMRGFAGNDTLSGGLGDDTLDGGAGDDLLTIGSTSSSVRYNTNTFIGGTGNDRMVGGYSSDTYIYNLGDGNDTIVDYDGGYATADKLVFGEGISQADISLLANGDDLVVQVTDPVTGAVSTITIEKAVNSSLNKLESMEFNDGTVVEGDWITHFGIEQHGTAEDD
ncbi:MULTISPECIES: calcium-binding protein, partial [unclassified Shewanella]|uniref:calcium-binding protein n=1 Tax=unclassified Shewanella TaxID=196818 RepID=UPI0026E48C71